MNKILSDDSKFKCFCTTTENDDTVKIESKPQDSYSNLPKKINYPSLFMKSYVLLVFKDQECMDCLKSAKRRHHFALFPL